MKHIFHFLLLSIILAFLAACSKPPLNSEVPFTRIIVGDGPEDMVLAIGNNYERLIISCTDRRNDPCRFGEIVCYDLNSEEIDTLTRIHEPESVIFRPHGIFCEDSSLYVISHEHEPDDHIVLIYKIRGRQLIFEEMIRSELLVSPNALATGPKGEIYVVNDSGKRGSLAEKLFRLKKANVIQFEKSNKDGWSGLVAADKLGYPAGINRLNDKLFVGDAVLHKFHVFKITDEGLIRDTEIDGLKGNDNIRIYKDQLLSPGHVKPFKFVGHAGNPEKLSPVEVYLVDPESGSFKSIFFDDGHRISGGSTAIIHKDQLFICQVFEPYILKVQLKGS